MILDLIAFTFLFSVLMYAGSYLAGIPFVVRRQDVEDVLGVALILSLPAILLYL